MVSYATAADKPQEAASTEPLTGAYRHYAMGVLLSLAVMNYIDRTIINILAEPIKRDLGLADWQIGLMSGLAFALFYTTAGIPIARLAERHSRPLIIGLCIGAWSVFTVACGFCVNFVQLVIARIGVGIGESGCFPPAHSLISDYTTKARRASALAFFSLGTPIGSLLGKSCGGILADLYGWRAAFMLAGAPGIVLALLSIFTLREPRKHAPKPATKVEHPKFVDALRILKTKRAFWLMAAAYALKIFISSGQAPFAASYFLRNHPEQIAELAARFGLGSVGFVGVSLGLSMGILGVIGTWIGGQVADRYGTRDPAAYMTLPAVAGLFMALILSVAFTTENAALGLFLVGLNSCLGAMSAGPIYAACQGLAPSRIRPTATAILLLVINLIGMGFGPIGVGLLSDIVAGPMGMGSGEGVRWALLVSTVMGLFASILYVMARGPMRREIES